MWLAIGWLGCGGGGDDGPSTPSLDSGGPQVPVEISVDGAVVFDGVADAPENGLYQPAAPDRICAASRRIGVFKGTDLYLEVLFPGEQPVSGSEVVFPASVDVAAGDWNVAGWRSDDGRVWGAYGGIATLVAFGRDGAEVVVRDATVCTSDRIGSLEDPDALWRDHTSDCDPGVTVRFRTLEPLPFDPGLQTWCSAGGPGSWLTPAGERLCSVDRLPCAPEVER